MSRQSFTKPFRSILLIFIAFVLTFSAICIGTSAYTLSEAENLEEYDINRINVFANSFLATDDETKSAIDIKVLCGNVCNSGYDLCYIFSGACLEEEGYGIVDGYMYKYNSAQIPYALGWYLINDSDAITLEQGCNKNIVSLKGENGNIIRSFLNAPLVSVFVEETENSRHNFFILKNYLIKNNAYSEKFAMHFLGTADEFEIAIYNNNLGGKPYEETIGNYVYSADNCQAPFGLGLYIIKNEEIMTLSEAFEQGIELEKVNSLLSGTEINVDKLSEADTTASKTECSEPTESTDTTVTEPAKTDSTTPTCTEPVETTSVSTTTTTDSDNKYEETVVSKFLTPEEIKDYELNVYYYELYEYYSENNTDKSSPDYVLFYLSSGIVTDGPWATVIGDYYFSSNGGEYPYSSGYGIYIPLTDEVFDIESAYKLQIEGIDNIFTEAGIGKLIGDMDKDRKLTIKDATIIQKGLANLIEFSGDPIEAFIQTDNPPLKYGADFNRDCKLNIKDATAIQKHLVGLEY